MITEPSDPGSSKYFFLVQILLFAGLFIPLFIFHSIAGIDFWWWMSINISLLFLFTVLSDKSYLKILRNDLSLGIFHKIMLGILSAIILYVIFYLGNQVSRWIFTFAGEGINQVYAFKQDASTLRIILLMVLMIGPGEEVIWRGYLQRHWESRFGRRAGYFLSAAVYSLVHAASGNIMLIGAAGVCALFWGWIYLRYRSILLVAVSHTVWDLFIFIILPLS
jgi:uncharacterized protein